jgi:uncharacterized protein YjiK
MALGRLTRTLALGAIAATSCGLPGRLTGDGVAPGSPLAGLERAAAHQVTGVSEPSDLAYDAAGDTLWVVSDSDGRVYRLTAAGERAGEPIDVGGRDLEGVAFDPQSGHLFVLDESSREVIEVTTGGAVLGRFSVPGKSKGRNSFEGIAVDPARGEIILASEREPVELVFCDRAGAVKRRVRVRTEDLSAVTLAPGGETLVAVARFEEALLELDRDGKILSRMVFNDSGVEGVAFGPGGRLYLAADHGSAKPGELFVFAKGGPPWR